MTETCTVTARARLPVVLNLLREILETSQGSLNKNGWNMLKVFWALLSYSYLTLIWLLYVQLFPHASEPQLSVLDLPLVNDFMTCTWINTFCLLHYVGIPFLFNHFLDLFLLCTLTTAISPVILLHCFVHSFDTMKIPAHCSGTQILWNRWLAHSFCFLTVSCYVIFTWIWKSHNLIDTQLTALSFQ